MQAETTTMAMPLDTEILFALNMRNTDRRGRERLAMEVLRRRRSELTLTWILKLPRQLAAVREFCDLAARGQRLTAAGVEEASTVPPLMPMVRLRSRRRDAEGRFLPIPYKTAQEPGNAAELHALRAAGRPQIIVQQYEVDEATGDFEVPYVEAVKILRFYGRGIVSRWRYPAGARLDDRKGTRSSHNHGDRWLVEEVAHLGRYVDDAAGPEQVRALVVGEDDVGRA